MRTWQWGGCSSRPMRSSSWAGMSLQGGGYSRRVGVCLARGSAVLNTQGASAAAQTACFLQVYRFKAGGCCVPPSQRNHHT